MGVSHKLSHQFPNKKGLVKHNGNRNEKSKVVEKTHKCLHKSSCSLNVLEIPLTLVNLFFSIQ